MKLSMQEKQLLTTFQMKNNITMVQYGLINCPTDAFVGFVKGMHKEICWTTMLCHPEVDSK